MQGATTQGSGQVGITTVDGGDPPTVEALETTQEAQTAGNGDQSSSLDASTDLENVDSLIGWIRASPLTVEEAKLLVDLGILGVTLTVLVLEARGGR